MRDPWHPPLTILDLIEPWQTSIGAAVALCAAGLAFWNTTRTLRNSERLEIQRRRQKQIALRAVLPLALSEIAGYATSIGKTLFELHRSCVDRVLVHASAVPVTFDAAPRDVISIIADFIEYSDQLDVQLFVHLIRRIQVQQARLGSLSRNIARSHGSTSAYDIEHHIVDCAAVYAGAVAAFDYARQEMEILPSDIVWKNVRSGLKNMGLWQSTAPTVHQVVDRLEQNSNGPR